VKFPPFPPTYAGGSGGGIAYNIEEYKEIVARGLRFPLTTEA